MKRIDAPSTSQLDFIEQPGLAVAELSEAAIESLIKKSEKSGIPFDVLEQVYRRGIFYWEEGLNVTEEQFAFQRVNSFVAGGLAREMDSDLMEKRGLWDNIHAKRERIKRGSGERMRKPGSPGAPTAADFKASQVKEAKDPNDPLNRQIGTDSLVDNYKSTTPGQATLKAIKKVVKEATYQGKSVTLNKPFYTPGEKKKSAVYVDPDGDGKAQVVRFGDPNMKIKKSSPAHRKSFRARHGCDNPGPKTKAKYWSCRAW